MLELSERGLFGKNSYKATTQKSTTLLCYLDNPAAAKQKAVSPWTQYSDLTRWGWELERRTQSWDHIRKSVRTTEWNDTLLGL